MTAKAACLQGGCSWDAEDSVCMPMVMDFEFQAMMSAAFTPDSGGKVGAAGKDVFTCIGRGNSSCTAHANCPYTADTVTARAGLVEGNACTNTLTGQCNP